MQDSAARVACSLTAAVSRTWLQNSWRMLPKEASLGKHPPLIKARVFATIVGRMCCSTITLVFVRPFCTVARLAKDQCTFALTGAGTCSKRLLQRL
eukprot:5516140-Amphidinium_carterae.1